MSSGIRLARCTGLIMKYRQARPPSTVCKPKPPISLESLLKIQYLSTISLFIFVKYDTISIEAFEAMFIACCAPDILKHF